MNIWVMFGSTSTEHDVSVASAFGVMQGLIKTWKHKVFPIYITKQWQRIYEPDFVNIKTLKELIEKDYSKTSFHIDFSQQWKLCATQKYKSILKKDNQIDLDVCFLVLHGKNGEDGSIQGLLEMLNVPYVSPGVLGSATCMNKITMKEIFLSNKIPTVEFVSYAKGQENITEIEKLWYPIFVKPASLWSSIGVSKVNNTEELKQAIEVAFHYDSYMICEKAVENLVELNCSILIDKDKTICSEVEQPMTNQGFLSFEEKYINDGWSMAGVKSKVKIPAPIAPETKTQIHQLCKKIAQIMNIDGGAPRIDFLFDQKANKLYVNEVNTIPGAMQMHLRYASKMSINDFLKTLIQTAIFKQEKKWKESKHFNSKIIDMTINFKK